MKNAKRTGLLLALALLLTLAFSAHAARETEEAYYIKNNYATGAYLYEAAGQLYYGVPTEGDASFRWIVEETEGGFRIRNGATGHYISLNGHGTADSAFEDPVRCVPDGDETALWTFEIGEAQNIISACPQYEGFGLHLEDVTDGRVRAQRISGDQLKWGNMKWNFLKAEEINFSAALREGICIQTESGAYLRAQNGGVAQGVPEGPDDSFIWTVEEQSNGAKALKNVAAGQYLTLNGGSYALSDTAAPIWFQIGMSARPAETLAGQADTPLRWNVYPASQVGNVAGDLTVSGVYCLKNSWYSMYLVESGGYAVYGNVSPNDENAQWEFLYDAASGLTAVRNKGTGHFLRPAGDGDKLACTEERAAYWKLLRNTNDLYPDAVVLQDSVNPAYFVHMENLTGFAQCSNAVQPTWGTPHWSLRLCEGGDSEVGRPVEAPEGWVRIESAGAPGNYLYENASGVVVYGDRAENDARSHWEMVKDGESGLYYIKNREYGNYILVNPATGTMKCVELENAAGGGVFRVVKGSAEGAVLIGNAFQERDPYQYPYINIAGLTGAVKSTLQSTDDKTTQWVFHTAPEDTNAVEDDEDRGYICPNTYPDTCLWELFNDGAALKGRFLPEYFGDGVRLKNVDSGKYLVYTPKDGLGYKTMDSKTDASVLWGISTRAGSILLKCGDQKLTARRVIQDAVYSAEDAYANNGMLTFVVYADAAGTYTVDIGGAPGAAEEAELYINGLPAGRVSIPSKGVEMALNKGVNSIRLGYTRALSQITIHNCSARAFRGAFTGAVVYEAETCETNASVLEDSRSYYEIAAEASGRSAVKLDGTGKYIKFTLLEDANALTFRFCVPDSEDGAGADYTLDLTIDGVKTQIPMTSRYTWVYGAYPYTNDPGDGLAHNFFDDVTVKLDKIYPAGTEIRISKGASSYAPWYIVDLVESELAEGPLSRPENSLSITDFGAAANDGLDDTEAFLQCMDAAAAAGKEIWIPAGEFLFEKDVLVIARDGVTVRGAGMWHTVLTGDGAAFIIKASNTAFYDFSMRGTAVIRRDSVDPAAFEADRTVPGKENLTIQNVWIEHYKVGVWTYQTSGVHIAGCRIRNTFADGINLCMATCNSMVEQNSIRGTGDDAVAMWSQKFGNVNNTVRFNTIALPDLANCIAVFGGSDIRICDNLISDTVTNGAGINISTNFDPTDFGGTITVERNSLFRCGSTDSAYGQDYGGIWINTVKGFDNNAYVRILDNLIAGSSYQGISFSGGGASPYVTLEGNTIVDSGTWAIDAAADSRGAADVKNNLMRGNGLGTVNNSNEGRFVFNIILQDRPDDEKPAGIPGMLWLITGGAAAAAGCAAAVLLTKKKSKNKKGGKSE